MTFSSMSPTMGRLMAVAFVTAALVASTRTASARQNQTPAQPQAQGQPPAGGRGAAQAPAGGRGAANATPGAAQPAPAPEPPPPPGIPLYISPGIVLQIQQKLVTLGFPVPSVSGAWGDNSAAALAAFQAKNGLDAGGDLDELTLVALGMPGVLKGDVPPGGDTAVTPPAIATGGGPLHASPRLARVVQTKLTDGGFPTDNVFGIWMAGSESAARAYQKAKGLDITGTLDLSLIHSLGLDQSLTDPKPGKLPSDSVAQILAEKAVIFTGAPLTIGPAGIKQIQTALQQRGMKDVVVDGKWSDALGTALKTFQESQKLEATGSVNLRTLKALGFQNPLVDLDQPQPAAPPKPTK